jgi:glycosyltransferase involved in cell wall biosynthesis
MREQFIDHVFNNYLTQIVKVKELIIILNDEDMNLAIWQQKAETYPDISVFQLPKKTSLGKCLNFGVRLAKYDLISKLDDDDYYAPEYLSEQMNAMQKTNADIVCKRTVFMYFEKEKQLALHLDRMETNTFMRKSGGIKGATLVMRKKVCKKVRFPHVNLGEDSDFLKKCLKKRYKIYATDAYNYVCLRRSAKHHTWRTHNDELMEESKLICKTDNYKKFIEQEKDGQESENTSWSLIWLVGLVYSTWGPILKKVLQEARTKDH